MASTGKDREFWDMLNLQLREIGMEVRGGQAKEVMFVELGGLKQEGVPGEAVDVSKDNVHLMDSTMLEADPGAPTTTSVIIRRKQPRLRKTKWQTKAPHR